MCLEILFHLISLTAWLNFETNINDFIRCPCSILKSEHFPGIAMPLNNELDLMNFLVKRTFSIFCRYIRIIISSQFVCFNNVNTCFMKVQHKWTKTFDQNCILGQDSLEL